MAKGHSPRESDLPVSGCHTKATPMSNNTFNNPMHHPENRCSHPVHDAEDTRSAIEHANQVQQPGRRQFLHTSIAASLAVTMAGQAAPALATNSHRARATGAKPITSTEPRQLNFRNIHTGETLTTVYWQDGEYVDNAVLGISHLMRDHRENETMLMDQPLLDVLWQVQQAIDPNMQFDVISGYRTPKTNAMLRKRSNGVAKFSLHMVGRAVDISTHNVPLSEVRKAALTLKAGGIGYYPKSHFVHLDTGPFRAW